MKNHFLHKFLALLLIALGTAAGAFAQNVAKIGTTEYATLQEAFDAAADGKTIEVLSDITDFGAISFSGKQITLKLGGKVVKGTSITVGQRATLNIGSSLKDPAFNENDYTVTFNYKNSYSGLLKLKKSINAVDGGTVILKNAQVESEDVAFFAVGDQTGATSVASAVKIWGGYVKAQEFCVSPQGLGATVEVCNKPVLESLDNAVIAGNGTDTEEKRLGGTTINIKGGVLLGRIQSGGYAACGVYHPNSGTLNISGGKIIAVNGAGIVMRGGTLNLTSGSITATALGDAGFVGKVGDSRVVVGTSGIVFDRDCNYPQVETTSINIDGSSVTVSGVASALQVLNTDNKDISGKVSVKSGTFSSDVTPYLAAGSEIYQHDGVYSAGNFVAQVGDAKYTSAQTAIQKGYGKTVVLLKDCAMGDNQQSVSNGKIILDLNGKTLTGGGFNISGNGDLTIKDSSDKDGKGTGCLLTTATATDNTATATDNNNIFGLGIVVRYGGKCTLESGTIKNGTIKASGKKEVNVNKNVVFQVQGRASSSETTLNIIGGKIETEGTPISVIDKGATVNMTGGSLASSGLACIAGSGKENLGGTTINISGGTLTATAADEASAACGIYHPQEGTLNITGGTINVTDGVGVLMRGGKMSMTGGEVNATGDASKTGTVGDSRQVVSTSGVIFDRDSNYPAVATAEVYIDKEAKVSGAKAAVELINENNVADAKAAFKLKGGTYSSDVTALLDENSITTKNEADGTYSITNYCAKVGDQKYFTLKEAFEAATDGQTVTVINDTELGKNGVEVAEDKALTLDLNGCSVKAANQGGENFLVYGKLTLQDSKEGSTAKIYSESPYVGTNKYDNPVLQVLDGGEFVMNSGYIKTVCDDAVNKGNFAVGLWDASKATINGGTIEAGWYAVSGNGNETKSTSITINGGTLISTADYAIYHPQAGKLTINNGVIYGEAGAVAMKRGELEVTGGTLTSKGKGDTGTWGDGTGNLANAALNFCKLYGNVKATIKGGTITAQGNAVVVDAQPVEGKTADIAISGGTYSSDVSAYCVNGFTATPNTDGTYGITEVGDAMLVYDKGYTDVKAGNDVEIDMDNISKVIIKAEVADVNVTLKKAFAYTGWNSIWLPFDVTLTADMLASFKFAKLYNLGLDDNENATLLFKNLKAGDKLKANFPCLIQPATTGEQTLALGKVNFVKPVDGAMIDCSSTEELYTFYAATENTYTAAKNGYYISSETSSFVYNTNKEAYIQPFKYYITIQNRDNNSYILPSQPSAQKVSYRVIDEGEATGITDIDADAKTVNAKVYNLQGVQVGTSTEGLPKGIYIQNGRKIMVK